MKVTTEGLDCLITYLLKDYKKKNTEIMSEDDIFSSIVSYLMNDNPYIEFIPEDAELQIFNYITESILNEL